MVKKQLCPGDSRRSPGGSSASPWMDARERFVARINEFVQQRIILGQIHLPGMDQTTALAAWRAGRSLISNPLAGYMRYIPLEEIDENTNPMVALRALRGETIIISEAPSGTGSQQPKWRLFAKDPIGFYQVLVMPHKLFCKTLAVRTRLGATGLPVPAIEAVVVGLWATLDGIQDRLFQEVLQCHQAGDLLVGTDRIIWYMGGDLLQWYQTLLRHGELWAQWTVDKEYYDSLVEHSNIGPEPLSEKELRGMIRDLHTGTGASLGGVADIDVPQVGAPTWIIFESQSFPGTFLRILSAGASRSVSIAMMPDIEKGKLRVIPRDQVETRFHDVLKVRLPIALTWNRF